MEQTLPSLFSSYSDNLYWLENRVILCGLVGSRGYGIYTEESDWDFKGICIPPKEYILGNLHSFEQAQFGGENREVVIFNIKKFFFLAADCNPNIIEMLFLEEYIPLPRFQRKFMEKVLSIRDHFLTKKAKHTFGGYAFSQLKRMETHRKWLLNPPSHKPTREEFNLPNVSFLSKDQLETIKSIEGKGEELSSSYSEEILSIYFKERQYADRKREWDQYQNWTKNRNIKRASLEKKCGYDAKHALHLVRLLKMGIEILRGEGVRVKREEDKDYLLSIRRGEVPYEDLMGEVGKLNNLLEEAHEKSPLPHSPNREYIDDILVGILEEAYYGWKD